MLIAETKDGQKIEASDLTMKPTETLFCPGCKEPVMLKKGTLKLPHFAHFAHAACASFSEGETREHLSNKFLLQVWSGTGKLEAYLPQLKQRPDLLVDRLAIEVQCSPLSLERMIERTQNYQRHGYFPWWLLGLKLTPHKRWRSLQKAFSYYSVEKGIHLWSIDAGQKEIRLLYDIRWHFRLGCVYRVKTWSFMEKDFAQVRAFRTALQPFHWHNADYRYQLQKKLLQDDPQTRELQKKFYLLGGNLQTLPDWCYQASLFHFYFADRLLFLRYCYLLAKNFSEWLAYLKQLEFPWLFPLVSQKEILLEVYQECGRLTQTDVRFVRSF